MEPENETLIDKILKNFSYYRKESMIGAFSFLGLAIALIVIGNGKSSYQSFLQAEKLFARWEDSSSDFQLFDQLSLFLKKHPDLIDKYEGKISQKLIELGQSEQAALYAESPISRLEKISLPHANFSETTLLIEAGCYQEALEKTIRLKESMSSEDSILYAHNLFRIATLQQRLQNDPGELAAWNDFESFLEWKDGNAIGTVLSQAMLQAYGTEEISLLQYIADRKTAISSKKALF